MLRYSEASNGVSNRDEATETRLASVSIPTIFVALAIEARYSPFVRIKRLFLATYYLIL